MLRQKNTIRLRVGSKEVFGFCKGDVFYISEISEYGELKEYSLAFTKSQFKKFLFNKFPVCFYGKKFPITINSPDIFNHLDDYFVYYENINRVETVLYDSIEKNLFDYIRKNCKPINQLMFNISDDEIYTEEKRVISLLSSGTSDDYKSVFRSLDKLEINYRTGKVMIYGDFTVNTFIFNIPIGVLRPVIDFEGFRSYMIDKYDIDFSKLEFTISSNGYSGETSMFYLIGETVEQQKVVISIFTLFSFMDEYRVLITKLI
jgi:hypothetical protein